MILKRLQIFTLFVILISNASCQESGASLFRKGAQYYNSHDYNNAIIYFTKAANYNYTDAYNALGIMYLNGIGVNTNYNKAYQYFVTGYNIGENTAESNFWLGRCYYTGKGVAQNLNKAFNFFKIAFDKGYADAGVCIGLMYLCGDGLPKNYKNAVYYLNYSANEGNDDALLLLGICYCEGAGVEKDQDLGLKYIRQAGNLGNKQANEILDSYNREKYIDIAKFSLQAGWTILNMLK